MTEIKDIAKGEIGNALTSTASNHIVAVADEIYDEEQKGYQSEINKETKESINDLALKTNNIYFEVPKSVDGYIINNTNEGDIVDITVYIHQNYECVICPVSAGRTYYLTATAGSTARAYCLTDNNYVCKKVSASDARLTDEAITPVVDGYIIINNQKDVRELKFTSDSVLNTLQEKINEVDNRTKNDIACTWSALLIYGTSFNFTLQVAEGRNIPKLEWNGRLLLQSTSGEKKYIITSVLDGKTFDWTKLGNNGVLVYDIASDTASLIHYNTRTQNQIVLLAINADGASTIENPYITGLLEPIIRAKLNAGNHVEMQSNIANKADKDSIISNDITKYFDIILQNYITATGALQSSTHYNVYKIESANLSGSLKITQNDIYPNYYSVAFYNGEPSTTTFIKDKSIVSKNELGRNIMVDIPTGTKCILISNRFDEEGASPFKVMASFKYYGFIDVMPYAEFIPKSYIRSASGEIVGNNDNYNLYKINLDDFDTTTIKAVLSNNTIGSFVCSIAFYNGEPSTETYMKSESLEGADGLNKTFIASVPTSAKYAVACNRFTEAGNKPELHLLSNVDPIVYVVDDNTKRIVELESKADKDFKSVLYDGRKIDINFLRYKNIGKLPLSSLPSAPDRYWEGITLHGNIGLATERHGLATLIDLSVLENSTPSDAVIGSIQLEQPAVSPQAYAFASPCFGVDKYDDTDEFPLLYQPNGFPEDRYCLVHRVTRTSADIVQRINFNRGNDEGYGFYIAIDKERRLLYRWATKLMTWKETPEDNMNIVSVYNIPKLSDGAEVNLGVPIKKLGEYRWIPYYDGANDYPNPQGCFYYNNRLYMWFGRNSAITNHIYVVDTNTGELLNDIKYGETIMPSEGEGLVIYNGTMYLLHTNSDVVKMMF